MKNFLWIFIVVFLNGSCSHPVSDLSNSKMYAVCGYEMSDEEFASFKYTSDIVIKASKPILPTSHAVVELMKKSDHNGSIACVLMGFKLTKFGEINDVVVLSSGQDRSLERSAINALRGYEFKGVKDDFSGILSIEFIAE